MILLGTIIGGGPQGTARIACEFSVNIRRRQPGADPDGARTGAAG
jgi:hypothetical protein